MRKDRVLEEVTHVLQNKENYCKPFQRIISRAYELKGIITKL